MTSPASEHVAPRALPWQQTAQLPLSRASEIAGVSTSSLYALEAQGKLTFRRLAGRTLVSTPSLISLIESSEPWKPSERGKEARATRKERARAAWPE
jgi:hypothetical protein